MKLADYYTAIARDRTRYYQTASGLSRLLQSVVERHSCRGVMRAVAGADSVADIGCGFGKYLVGLDHARKLFLCDLSPDMIRAARDAVEARYPDLAVSTRVGSMLELPVEEIGTHDLVLSIGVINHLSDDELDTALAGLARLAGKTILLYYAHEGFLLASGVGVSFRNSGVPYRYHTRKDVRVSLAGRGFTRTRSSYLFVAPWFSPLVMDEFRRTAAEPKP